MSGRTILRRANVENSQYLCIGSSPSRGLFVYLLSEYLKTESTGTSQLDRLAELQGLLADPRALVVGA
jgi:hypothetical protein